MTLDPGIALDPERKQTFLSASIFKELIPLKREIKFFDGDTTFLPPGALKSIHTYSSKLADCRMSAPYVVLGEVGHDKDRYFNNLDQLEEDDRAFALRVYTLENAISAIVIYYTSGKALWNLAGYGVAKADIYDFEWHDLQRPVEAVIIDGHQPSNDTRTVVDKITVRTLDATREFQFHTTRAVTVRQTRVSPPAGGWDLRGFWGCGSEDSGFTQLGCIWGRTNSYRGPTVPSLFGGKASGLNTSLSTKFGEFAALGGYFQISPCAGDVQLTATTCFASHLFGGSRDRPWETRGTQPGEIIFYTSGDNFQCIRMWYAAMITIDLPRPPKAKADANTQFVYQSEDSPKISEVKIRTKKRANDAGLPSFVQITHSMPGKPSPVLFGKDPGNDVGVEVVCKPPVASAGMAWYFGGFYGTANEEVIESLGVVWARFDLPKAPT